jgi:hypothetical protein
MTTASRHLHCVALVLTLLLTPAVARGQAAAASDVAVKAAFIFNFAKFTEWPALPPAAPINICIAGDEPMAVALAQTVREQKIGGHGLAVVRPVDSTAWPDCQVLFIAANATVSAAVLDALRPLPVLTVSDRKGFSQTGGVIELYLEAGRMRFAINVDAAEDAGLRLSSRLLALARVVRSPDGR